MNLDFQRPRVARSQRTIKTVRYVRVAAGSSQVQVALAEGFEVPRRQFLSREAQPETRLKESTPRFYFHYSATSKKLPRAQLNQQQYAVVAQALRIKTSSSAAMGFQDFSGSCALNCAQTSLERALNESRIVLAVCPCIQSPRPVNFSALAIFYSRA